MFVFELRFMLHCPHFSLSPLPPNLFQILQASARSAVNRDEELNEVYRKTQKYVERFNSMANPEKDHQELVEELDNLQEYVLLCCSNCDK